VEPLHEPPASTFVTGAHIGPLADGSHAVPAAQLPPAAHGCPLGTAGVQVPQPGAPAQSPLMHCNPSAQ
jgi:hypothetical protein